MRAGVVYDWERNYVEPRDIGMLSRDDVRALVRNSSGFLGICPPEVRFVKASSSPCKALFSTWEIRLSDWGRNRVTVLHEVAHFGSLPAVLRGEDGHGPSFVATAIRLYSRFIGLDADMLRTSALRVGIAVGDLGMARATRG